MTRLLLTAAMILAPALATAQCNKDRHVMSCPAGKTWDEKTRSCILQSS